VKRYKNFIGIDDTPLPAELAAPVGLVGVVYTNRRLDGVITAEASRDGSDSTEAIASAVEGCRFNPRVVLLGGIAVGGFNVVDVLALSERLSMPVLVVARQEPDLDAIRSALLNRVPGGREKWALIEKAGPMEALGQVWVQRANITPSRALRVLEDTTLHGKMPEPLRVAHLVAGAIGKGQSRGRA